MKKVAQFEKVSFEQFKKDMVETFVDACSIMLPSIYDEITTPKRSTKRSAGHDFRIPFKYVLRTDETVKIPTGIRCKMDEDQVMFIFPRSSLGIKKNMVITNTVGVIDSDYYNSDNEGHIFVCIKNCGNSNIVFEKNDAFCQAVFVNFGVADDEEITNERTGGIGSTGK